MLFILQVASAPRGMFAGHYYRHLESMPPSITHAQPYTSGNIASYLQSTADLNHSGMDDASKDKLYSKISCFSQTVYPLSIRDKALRLKFDLLTPEYESDVVSIRRHYQDHLLAIQEQFVRVTQMSQPSDAVFSIMREFRDRQWSILIESIDSHVTIMKAIKDEQKSIRRERRLADDSGASGPESRKTTLAEPAQKRPTTTSISSPTQQVTATTLSRQDHKETEKDCVIIDVIRQQAPPVKPKTSTITPSVTKKHQAPVVYKKQTQRPAICVSMGKPRGFLGDLVNTVSYATAPSIGQSVKRKRPHCEHSTRIQERIARVLPRPSRPDYRQGFYDDDSRFSV